MTSTKKKKERRKEKERKGFLLASRSGGRDWFFSNILYHMGCKSVQTFATTLFFFPGHAGGAMNYFKTKKNDREGIILGVRKSSWRFSR